MTPRRSLGDFGERVAAAHLEAAGLIILGRNVRVASGEIDLVAADGADCVFVEVRTRRGLPGMAAESLSGRKLNRMWRCAMDYCERESVAPERARIDFVSIDLDGRGRITTLNHLRGVDISAEWSEEERRKA